MNSLATRAWTSIPPIGRLAAHFPPKKKWPKWEARVRVSGWPDHPFYQAVLYWQPSPGAICCFLAGHHHLFGLELENLSYGAICEQTGQKTEDLTLRPRGQMPKLLNLSRSLCSELMPTRCSERCAGYSCGQGIAESLAYRGHH